MGAFPGFVEPNAGLAWLLFGIFIYCVGSGLVPVLNAEVFLLAVAAVVPPGAIVPAVLTASLGQMTAKSVLYYAGRGVLSIPLGKHQARLHAAGEQLNRSSLGPGGFVFVSSTTGLPPFTAVSILAGTMRLPLVLFLLTGFAGRLTRFGLLVLFPQVAKGFLK